MKKEMNGKVYCRYTVIDLETGYALIYGEKWKDYYLLNLFNEHISTFRSGLFFRKIDEYYREVTIKGRKCVIVFWANAPIRKTGSVVSAVGCFANLSGHIYDNTGAVARFRALLYSFGYSWKKVGKK